MGFLRRECYHQYRVALLKKCFVHKGPIHHVAFFRSNRSGSFCLFDLKLLVVGCVIVIFFQGVPLKRSKSERLGCQTDSITVIHSGAALFAHPTQELPRETDKLTLYR